MNRLTRIKRLEKSASEKHLEKKTYHIFIHSANGGALIFETNLTPNEIDDFLVNLDLIYGSIDGAASS